MDFSMAHTIAKDSNLIATYPFWVLVRAFTDQSIPAYLVALGMYLAP